MSATRLKDKYRLGRIFGESSSEDEPGGATADDDIVEHLARDLF